MTGRGDPVYDDAEARLRALVLRRLLALPYDVRAHMADVGIRGVEGRRVDGPMPTVVLVVTLHDGTSVDLCTVPTAAIFGTVAEQN